MKDHKESIEILRKSTRITRYISKLIPVSPCSYDEHIYINDIELDKPELRESLKKLLIKYSLLYITTIGLVNIEKIWSSGLSSLEGTGAGIMLFIFVFALYIEILIQSTKNKFALEI